MMPGNIGTVSGLAALSSYAAAGFAYIQLITVPRILPIAFMAFPLVSIIMIGGNKRAAPQGRESLFGRVWKSFLQ